MISPVTADDPAPIQGTSMISIFAPAGIGEVVAGTDLATAIITAAEADRHGPLQDGDIVVVTSKIISKAEGRIEPASQRAELITAESRPHRCPPRSQTRIVRTHGGTDHGRGGCRHLERRGGVDPAAATSIPTRSATALREQLVAVTGLQLGVIISDTAGRPWRIGSDRPRHRCLRGSSPAGLRGRETPTAMSCGDRHGRRRRAGCRCRPGEG